LYLKILIVNKIRVSFVIRN